MCWSKFRSIDTGGSMWDITTQLSAFESLALLINRPDQSGGKRPHWHRSSKATPKSVSNAQNFRSQIRNFGPSRRDGTLPHMSQGVPIKKMLHVILSSDMVLPACRTSRATIFAQWASLRNTSLSTVESLLESSTPNYCVAFFP